MKLVSIHIPALLLLFLLTGAYTVRAQVWTLQQCIDTAQVYNKNLQMSRNNIEISEQKEKEAKANLLPKIAVMTEYKYFTNLPYQLMPLSTFIPTAPAGDFREIQFGVPHNINANIQLTMPLYNPQVYGAIQTTRIAAELSQLQLQKTEEQIFFELSSLYYNAQILQHQLAFMDSNLVNAKKLLGNMELLYQQLLAKGTDVSKIKLQVAQLSTQRESVSSTYAQVLNALKLAVGISMDQSIQVDPTIQQQESFEYASATTLDLRMMSVQNRIITNDLSILNKSRFLPSLNLFATYGTTGFGYSGQPEGFLDFYPVGFAGIQLSYPLFNGTVTQRKLDQKALELKNNELQTSLVSEQNDMQVEIAKMQREIAGKTVENTTEQINLAKSIYEQTILQQKHGTANLTDVLLADNTLREAQQAYLSALVGYLKADLELKKLTGNISTHH